MGITERLSYKSGRHPLLLLILLICIGLIGNYFNFLIFYRVEFIFGSILTLLAVVLFGTTRGVIATFIVSSYTFFLTLFFVSRHLDQQIDFLEEKIVTDLHSNSEILRYIVADWIDRQVEVVETIAAHIGNPNVDDPVLIQERLPQWQKAAPGFSRIAVLNSDATSIAYLPMVNDLGTSNIGIF